MRSGGVVGAALVALALVHAAVTFLGLLALSPWARALNVVLLAVEVVLVAFAALLFSSLRPATLPATGRAPGGAVDVLVPVRNESAEVLRATLQRARRMADPGGGHRILVVDDSDAAHAPDVARVCDELRVPRLHRPQRRGYKAGALNDALRATRAPFVAVLDVDHQPEPDFLTRAMPHFAPRVAYVQTILEWRNDDSLLRRLAALLQRQFYHGVQMDKAARERAVFTGSGAIFRRAALDDVGGFPEDTLVEDFDLTLQLHAAGWKGRFAPQVGARGLLPWSARDLAKQLWRWSHGTTEVVRMRAIGVLRDKRSPLLPRLELLVDGCAYLAGGTMVAAALLLVAAGALGVPVVRPLEGWSLMLAPVAVAAAHLTTAAQALRRAGERDLAILPLYHVVSLAFTPVLLVSSLLALVGVGRGFEGRVSKHHAPAPRRHGLRVGIAAAAGLGVVAIATASAGSLPLPAAGWVGFLGVSFAVSAATALPAAPARA